MSWLSSTAKRFEKLTEELKGLRLALVKQAQNAAALAEKLDRMQQDHAQKIGEYDRRYFKLLEKYIALAEKKTEMPGIPQQITPKDMMGLFEELPVGDPEGWEADALNLGPEYEEMGVRSVAEVSDDDR